ncbi:7710_t:CDS:2 [Scutellospora calospora]|uniref:7710_t:CDS:1 n=1 Tax=Scutellospora calospora TaxID=85575 RepID=A0ACA9L3G1_9GLOM|nr:7710_t:CDS:2 [Scutellospora calospora]
MNMLKAFVELNWDIDIKIFAQCQGYRTDNQLEYFQKCIDHHKAWDSICNIYRYSMASELIWPYVLNHNNPTPNGYLEWAKAQTSETYKLKFEQAIVNFRTGVRTNQSLLRNAARRQFAPIWSARRHPIYKLLEVSYEETLLNLKPQIRENIENFSVLSRSGLQNQHQGLDAIIEEINKALKSLIPPVPSQHHWEIAARNYVNFLKDNENSEQRTQPNSYMEQQRFRTYLRKKQFLNPTKMNSAFTNLDGEINLSEEMKSFSVLTQEKRQVFIKHTLMQNTSIDTWRAIPVTEQEAEIMKNESTMRKEELISVINSILISLPETQCSKYTNLKNKTKTILLTILQEIRGLNNAEDAIDEENEDKELIDEEMI